MDSLTAHSEGHVHTVVDQKGNIVLLGHVMESLRSGNEMPGIACLVAVLHKRDAAAKGSVHDVTDVLVAQNRGRGVCDQIKAAVNRRAAGSYRRGHGEEKARLWDWVYLGVGWCHTEDTRARSDVLYDSHILNE